MTLRATWGWLLFAAAVLSLALGAAARTRANAASHKAAPEMLAFFVELQFAVQLTDGGHLSPQSTADLESKIAKYPESLSKDRLMASILVATRREVTRATIDALRGSPYEADHRLAEFPSAESGRKRQIYENYPVLIQRQRLVREAMAVALGEPDPTANQRFWNLIKVSNTWFFLTIGIGVVAIIAGLIRWRIRGSISSKGFPVNLPSTDDASRLIGYAGIALIIYEGSSYLGNFRGLSSSWTCYVGSAIFMLTLIMSGKLDRRALFANFNLRTSYVLAAIATFGVQRVAIMCFVPIAIRFHLLPPNNESLFSSPNVVEVLTYSFQAVVLAPVIEEIIFRGLVAPCIAKVTHPVTGILVSSICFAMVHPAGASAWIPIFIKGCCLATLAYYTKSLLPGIMVLAITNLSALIPAILNP